MNTIRPRRWFVIILIIALAVAALGWFGAGPSVMAEPASLGSTTVQISPTPNPRCGVAGGTTAPLAALKLSVGAPEPGGYVWDALIAGNGVQVVRPCRYYAKLGIAPSNFRFDCYDTSTEAIRNGNEPQFRTWVQGHRGLTWLIGNEPDLAAQDGMTATEYARMYRYFHSLIKGEDPTAQIAIGAVSDIDVAGSPNWTRYTWLIGALNAYQTLYGTQMPIEVWNFHMYNTNTADYNATTVREPITSFINFVRQTRGYTTQPIWLTEWGKLNGWLNPNRDPNLPGYRGNTTPDDLQHPQMVTLMRDWATWMQQDNQIARWFWFITTMEDWNDDFEFELTGWLFQEAISFHSGIAITNTTETTVYGVPPPTSHTSWVGAKFRANNQVVTVSSYDANQQSVTLSNSVSDLGQNSPYKIFRSSYPAWTPNALGVTYMYFCNPGVFSKRTYLPLILTTDTPTDSAASLSLLERFIAPFASHIKRSATSDTFVSPLPTPSPFTSPLPTPTPAFPNRLVIDDFEYNDSPTNHGWHVLHPQGVLSTISYKFDSRKLMSSVLHGGDRDFSYTYPGDPESGLTLGATFPFLSLQFVGYDGWWISADIRGSDDQDYTLLYKPQFGQPTIKCVGKRFVVQYNLGEGYLDNQWHDFGRNLAADLARMASGVQLQTVNRLTFNGQKFLDNVVLGRSPVIEDETPPRVNIHVEGIRGEGDEFISPAVFTPMADDGANGSGVGALFLRVDGRSWLRNYGQTSTLEQEGQHVLEIYAMDKAGNLSDIQTVRVRIGRSKR